MPVVRSPLTRVLGLVADVVARDPRVPAEARDAFRAAVVTTIEGELSRMFGGEELCIYIPKVGFKARKDRDQRIEAALSKGEALESIAQRERVSTWTVRRMRGRIGGIR